jgi:hypothetical protein
MSWLAKGVSALSPWAAAGAPCTTAVSTADASYRRRPTAGRSARTLLATGGTGPAACITTVANSGPAVPACITTVANYGTTVAAHITTMAICLPTVATAVM